MKISGSNSMYPMSPLAPSANPVNDAEGFVEDVRTKELVNQQMEPIDKKKDSSVTEESVIKAIEKANKALEGTYTNLKFSIHEKTKQIMVKVVNSQTQEVIREIPPEKVLDMVAKMWERAGILVDERR